MSRLLVLGVALFALVVVLDGSAVFAAAREVPDRVAAVMGGADTQGQSGSQISGAEFLSVQLGTPRDRVRGLLGAPEHASRGTVEGVEIECWAYGVAAGTGAYQLCFANGRLKSRFAF